MPEMGGLEVQDRLAETRHGIADHLHYRPRRRAHLCQALKAGAFDFLEKPLDGEVFSTTSARRWLAAEEQKRQAAADSPPAWPAHPREKEVLDLLVAGKTLKEIAAVRNVTVQPSGNIA